MINVPWETSQVHELDLTSTELSAECLENVLLRIPFFTYLGLGHCEFFTDKVKYFTLTFQKQGPVVQSIVSLMSSLV